MTGVGLFLVVWLISCVFIDFYWSPGMLLLGNFPN